MIMAMQTKKKKKSKIDRANEYEKKKLFAMKDNQGFVFWKVGW